MAFSAKLYTLAFNIAQPLKLCKNLLYFVFIGMVTPYDFQFHSFETNSIVWQDRKVVKVASEMSAVFCNLEATLVVFFLFLVP